MVTLYYTGLDYSSRNQIIFVILIYVEGVYVYYVPYWFVLQY